MYLINDSMANKQDKLHAEDFFLFKQGLCQYAV